MMRAPLQGRSTPGTTAKTSERYLSRQAEKTCASSRSRSTSRYRPSSRWMVSPRISFPCGWDGSVSVAAEASRSVLGLSLPLLGGRSLPAVVSLSRKSRRHRQSPTASAIVQYQEEHTYHIHPGKVDPTPLIRSET